MQLVNKNGKIQVLYLNPPIKINFNIKKIDIYIKITKLLTNYTVRSNYLAYETNVTNIPSISSIFNLDFIRKKREGSLSCYLQKGENGPFLILCMPFINEDDILSLKEIKENIILININAKYNFIILPVDIKETITFISNPTFSYPIIQGIYPNILDFTSIIYIKLIYYYQH